MLDTLTYFILSSSVLSLQNIYAILSSTFSQHTLSSFKLRMFIEYPLKAVCLYFLGTFPTCKATSVHRSWWASCLLLCFHCACHSIYLSRCLIEFTQSVPSPPLGLSGQREVDPVRADCGNHNAHAKTPSKCFGCPVSLKGHSETCERLKKTKRVKVCLLERNVWRVHQEVTKRSWVKWTTSHCLKIIMIRLA